MRAFILGDATMPVPTPGAHGLGRVTSIVAEGLLARGHDIVLIAKSGSTFKGMTLQVECSGYEGERNIAREALKLHKEWPADCIIDNGHLHYLSQILPDYPVINVYHDIYQPHSRCPILLSEGQRALMSVEFEDARIIPNALDPAAYAPEFMHASEPYALFMGALSPIKQPLLAIEAAARMGLKLVIAGQPLTGQLPVSEAGNVEYVGMVSGSHKAQLFQNARVFLQLGIGESFGLTTVEAGLYGTPVVGWPSGGTLDLIQYGTNGVFVVQAGKDKVQNVCDAIDRAFDLRRDECRAFAENLCRPEAQIDAYEQALADVMRGARW